MNETTIISLSIAGILTVLFGLVTFMIQSRLGEILSNIKELFSKMTDSQIDRKGLNDGVSQLKERQDKTEIKVQEHHRRINDLEEFQEEIKLKHNINHKDNEMTQI